MRLEEDTEEIVSHWDCPKKLRPPVYESPTFGK